MSDAASADRRGRPGPAKTVSEGMAEGIRALKARRYEDAERALGAAIAARASADGYLLRSAARERLGRATEARDDLLAAVRAPGGATPAVVERAATRLVKLGAIEAALSVVRRAPGVDRAERRRLEATLCLTAGRTHEGLAQIAAVAREHGEHALTHARWLRGFGDADGALLALDAAPPGKARDQARLRALCDRRDHPAAKALLATMTPATVGETVELARVAVRVGDFDGAGARLGAAIAADDGEVEAWAMLADLALWRGDVDGAMAAIARVGALEPNRARTSRQRGIAHALAGERGPALDALDAALAIDPSDPEALLWRGELRRAEHDLDGSLRDLDAGITASHGYPIAGHLSRMLTVTAAHDRASRSLNTTHEDAFAELLGLLEPVLGTASGGGRSHLTPALLEQLGDVLTKMRGNRTTRPSYVEAGRLRPLDVPIHTRFAARQIQDLLVVRSPEEVVRGLEELAEARGDEPTIHCHIGEIHLWIGDADRADEAFRRAIRDTPEVRWAYVGLCAAEMIRSRWEDALRWCERGIDAFPPPGRTMFAYRGEVYRRMGELDRAESDLRHMLELTPERISSWINLALVRRRRGDASLLSPVLGRLRRRAPGLMDDGCRELGLDALAAQDDDTTVKLFEHLLAMMRGNRSSSFVSYFTAGGVLRFVPR